MEELLPSYKELIQEIGKQINLRKDILFKRVLIMSAPAILTIIFAILEIFLIPKSSGRYSMILFICFGVWLLIATVGYCVLSWIFGVEKKIWLISFFDKKNISSKKSWKIARKLSIPILKFSIKIFTKFYLAISVVFLATVIILISLGAQERFGKDAYMGFYAIIILVIIITMVAIYLISLKLRFVWFCFLNRYRGEKISFNELLAQAYKLNDIKKTESFQKALIADIGVSSAEAMTKAAINLISISVSKFGRYIPIIGGIFKAYGDESTKQISDLSRITAMYILYIHAYKVLYNQDISPNEYIYSLAND